jgi:hypothetical protein
MRFRIGEVQAGALEVYVFDPVHMGFEPGRRSMRLEQTERGQWFFAFDEDDAEEVHWTLVEAANSADDLAQRDRDPAVRLYARQDRDALSKLAERVLRR